MAHSEAEQMSYQQKMIKEDPRRFLHQLCTNILLGPKHVQEVETLLAAAQKCDGVEIINKYRDASSGDTLLHTVAQFHQDARLLKKLLDLCPELLNVPRTGEYAGQTVLHIAISKGNIKAVRAVLQHKSVDATGELKSLFRALALGSRFTDTVMMGQLPFTVAALTLNIKMVNLMLRHGAHIHARNSLGDTVFHSLIRYATVYPEKVGDIMNMMKHLHDKLPERPPDTLRDVKEFTPTKQDPLAIWFSENNDKLTPLKLAASLGQVDIFCMILNLESVYCHLDQHDGVFDIHLYDITEIDTVTQAKWDSARKREIKHRRGKVAPTDANTDTSSSEDVPNQSFSNCCCTPSISRSRLFPKRSKAVLEIICNIDVQQAFRLINVNVVRDTIKQKWFSYRTFYYLWMVFHMIMMSILTAYAIFKTKVINSNIYLTSSQTSVQTGASKGEETFVDVIWYFALLYGILYLILESIRSFYHRQGWYLRLIHHNGLYRMTLLLFSFSLIVDCVWFQVKRQNNYFLILALLLGWWFLTFFLRTHKKFSFFTVMFQKVLLGDMVRFSIIIILELLSFSIAMYITFLNTDKQHEGFEHLGVATLTMFKLMLGLTEIEVLFEARDTWLAVTLFVLFVLITYMLLINSLIAMMSQTCALVSEDRYTQWELQRLSVILMLESMIPSCRKYVPGQQKFILRYDTLLGKKIQETRFLSSVKSVQTRYSDGKAILQRKSFMRTSRFGDVSLMLASQFPMQHQQPMSSLLKDTKATQRSEEDDDDDLDDEDDDDDITYTRSNNKSHRQTPDLSKKTFFSEFNVIKSNSNDNFQSAESVDKDADKDPKTKSTNRSQESPSPGRKRHSSERKNRRTQTETANPLSRSFPDEVLRAQLSPMNHPGYLSERAPQFLPFLAVPSTFLSNQHNLQAYGHMVNNQIPANGHLAQPHPVNPAGSEQFNSQLRQIPHIVQVYPSNLNPNPRSSDSAMLQPAGEEPVRRDSQRSPGLRVQFLDINNLNSEA